MRKVSEILKLCMPAYRNNIGWYMCLLVKGTYTEDGDTTNDDNNITWYEVEAVRELIEDRIKEGNTLSFSATLDTHLMAVNPEYVRLAEIGDEPRMIQPELHNLRVQWFDNLIIELEKEGK